jgi:hypothetical protein
MLFILERKLGFRTQLVSLIQGIEEGRIGKKKKEEYLNKEIKEVEIT